MEDEENAYFQAIYGFIKQAFLMMVYFMALEMLSCVLTIYFMEQLFKISSSPIYFQPVHQ